MGLFTNRKAKQADWSEAYVAAPQFYEGEDGVSFGAIALTEGTETVLPKLPQNRYQVDGNMVSEWRLVLVSTTKDDIVGDADYFAALKRMEKYVQDTRQDSILVKGLSLRELESLGE